jgi:hypothetical protein
VGRLHGQAKARVRVLFSPDQGDTQEPRSQRKGNRDKGHNRAAVQHSGARHFLQSRRGEQQAYRRRFENKPPDKLQPPSKQAEALQWLSRELDDAILKFIKNTNKGDTLLCCLYEFRYQPVADALRAPQKKGITLKLIVDAKVNEHTDSKGKFHESFPRIKNLETIAKAGILQSSVIRREARRSAIQVPTAMAGIPQGVTTIFSPRSGDDVLNLNVNLLDKADQEIRAREAQGEEAADVCGDMDGAVTL